MRSEMRRPVRRIVAGALAVLALPLLAAGRVVDVGGHSLYLDCRGAGRPVIVLDAGLGGSAADWAAVQAELAATHTVCTFDRAGYGTSTPGPLPRHSARLASELRTLLARAGLSPPYVLGGHSLGALNVQVFAALFPRDVAGLVLVDPPHEQLDGVIEGMLLGRIDPQGVLRSLWQSGQLGGLLLALEPLAGVLGLDFGYLRSIVHELEAFPQSLEDARAATLDGALPLTVIAHGRRVLPPGPLGDDLERAWLATLREAACAHPRGRYVVAQTSGHMIPQEQPELVAAVVRAMAQGKDPADAEPRTDACAGAR